MMRIDEIDKRILRELQRDTTRSAAEIGMIVGLSQAPCWRRIQRLKEDGYIRQQVAILDRHEMDLKTQIFAQVKLTATGRSNVDAFTDAIKEFEEVLDCFVLLGSVDFMLRIVAHDIEAYERFFFEKLSKVPGVQEINSMVALSEIKSTTALPIA
jgi:Lrp/AsnC family transcriptional regulator